MHTSNWQHYEHEADIGVEGMGASIEDAFAQAAIALTEVITQVDNVSPEKEIKIHCSAPNTEILFVDWLNALIYEMASRKMLFSHFDLTISPESQAITLLAKVRGEEIDLEKHQPVVEIKGATFTTLNVFKDDSHIWHARTVVDV